MLNTLKKKIIAFIFTILGIGIAYAAVPVTAPNETATTAPITVERVSYNSNIKDNGDGTFTMTAYSGDVNYKEGGKFVKSDVTFADMGTYWEMNKHNYKLRVAKDFGANKLIQYTNNYKGANHTIIYEPKKIVWVNKTDLSDMVPFRNQQSVTGVLNAERNIITYKDAFGAGIDFEVTLFGGGFRKEIVINSKSALELPPTPQYKLVVLFKYTGNGLKIRRNTDKTLWDGISYKDSIGGYSIEETNGKSSYMRPAYIYDSSDQWGASSTEPQRIKVFWKKYNGNLYQAKILPTRFLKNATYPVRADTVTDYGTTVGDGAVYYQDSANWTTTRSSTVGSAAQPTVTVATTATGIWASSKYRIWRLFLPVDTSALPTGATVSAASFWGFVRENRNGDNDGSDFMVLIETTQASDTTLVIADYDNMTLNSPTEGSSRYDVSTFTTLAWKEMVLNTNGIGWIKDGSQSSVCSSSNGITCLGMREGHDVIDSAFVGAAYTYNMIGFSTVERATVSERQYLKITYTVGSTAIVPAKDALLFGF